MDTTITYDEVATLIGFNIPLLGPCPTFEKIGALCHHFERALQCLMELNDIAFCSPYSAADAPEVLFHRIKDCAEIAILGRNPYTDCQLINNAIRLLLTTGIYMQTFEEWDCLQLIAQTWVTHCTMIQEAFQRRLNAMAPIVGHHGYAPARPFQQNAIGTIVEDVDNNDKESIVESVANQFVALTYQSQSTASTTATTTQRNEQQLAAIAADQAATHSTLHQIIAQLNAVTFNASDAG
jgi:hypothetical protein